MIVVTKISDPTKRIYSSNSLQDDVARFWLTRLDATKDDIVMYYFELPSLAEGQGYNFEETGKLKVCIPAFNNVPVLDENAQPVLDENNNPVVEQVRDFNNDQIISEVNGQLLNWCYDENMKFIGYGI